MRKLTLVYLFLGLLVIPSCDQAEGFGGKASVQGKVSVQYYNDDFSLLLGEEPAYDEEVFISFGKNGINGDNTETNYNGDFLFEYLFGGDYQIYIYSIDSANPSAGEQPLVFDVSLPSGEAIDLGTLYIQKVKDWDEGNSTIHGQILLINYKNESIWPNFMVVKDTSFAQDVDVYLVYGNHVQYDERIRTMDDGTFTFNTLIKGPYRIFVYSEDLSGATQLISIDRWATITEEFQSIDLGTIYIEQL
jgi:hypothetical protein